MSPEREAHLQKLIALRAGDAIQARMDQLASKCTEGQLTDDEREEYETYVSSNNAIAILQAKARKELEGNDESK